MEPKTRRNMRKSVHNILPVKKSTPVLYVKHTISVATGVEASKDMKKQHTTMVFFFFFPLSPTLSVYSQACQQEVLILLYKDASFHKRLDNLVLFFGLPFLLLLKKKKKTFWMFLIFLFLEKHVSQKYSFETRNWSLERRVRVEYLASH